MPKITRFVIAVVLITMSASPALAQSLQYLGPSNDTAKGDTGILGFNALCQATYGDGAQFCTSKNVLESGSALSIPAGRQWIAPTIIEVFEDSVRGVTFVDITGVRQELPNDLNCRGWFDSSGTGLTIQFGGKFFAGSSCGNQFPAACCKVTSGQKSVK